jgi:hypothetical protein
MVAYNLYSHLLKHLYKTLHRKLWILNILNLTNTGGELRCFWWVGSFCSTSGTRGVSLVIDPVISHEWGKNQELFPRVEHIRTDILYYKIYKKKMGWDPCCSSIYSFTNDQVQIVFKIFIHYIWKTRVNILAHSIIYRHSIL